MILKVRAIYTLSFLCSITGTNFKFRLHFAPSMTPSIFYISLSRPDTVFHSCVEYDGDKMCGYDSTGFFF